MPNWVNNKLKITGKDAESVKKVIKHLENRGEEHAKDIALTKEGEEINITHIDFNKIVPMPKELNIVSGSITDRAVEMYLTSINPNVDYFGEEKVDEATLNIILKNLVGKSLYTKPNHSLHLEEINKRLEAETTDSKEYMEGKTYIEYGRQAVNNVLQYGAMDWYGWRRVNWGVKWNACDTVLVGDNTILFSTPWADVRELIEKLAKQFPDNTFEYEYAEEQAGYYTGRALYENGEMVEDIEHTDDSKEAYDLYFELWGGEDCFEWDEEKQTYIYTEE